MMTGPGTNTYLLGNRDVAVLDPGPAIDSYIEMIQQSADAPIRWILVTHTHPDHSPAAVRLAAATGADLLGMPAPEGKYQDATLRLIGSSRMVTVSRPMSLSSRPCIPRGMLPITSVTCTLE